NAGLQMNYYYNGKSAIQLEYDFLSVLNQKYSFYQEGSFVDTKIRLSHQKVYLGYKYSLGNRRSQRPVISLKAGGYFSFLKNENVITNEEQESINFNSMDYGVRVGIGREHFIKSLTIDYGINSDIGIRDITSITQNIPKKFSHTSTFVLGAYVSIRYNF
ncbi:hypothetical protein JYT21_00470, partial [bacterium AH-315-B15]|nr:hypothetical protein [bacterium AH-315-B15]